MGQTTKLGVGAREVSCSDEDGFAVYSFMDRYGETSEVTVCARHAEFMPLIDDDRVRAYPAEPGCGCDFAPHNETCDGKRRCDYPDSAKECRVTCPHHYAGRAALRGAS